jgi:hypothetical protein
MALPKLNTTPSHEMVQPSTGEKILYRPYLVKEEKILLLAFEGGDQKQAMRAMIDVVAICCDDVKAKSLTVFDVEYMFTQIRSRSVGETAEINIKCENEECDHATECKVNLQEIEVELPDVSPMIELTPSVSLELKYPAFHDFLNNFDEKMSETEFGFKMIGKCIKTIMTEDERIDANDVTQKEMQEFIDSMTNAQFEKIGGFMQSAPTMKHDVDFKCPSCGTEQSKTLKGIQDFF